jgi:hypothetical protein
MPLKELKIKGFIYRLKAPGPVGYQIPRKPVSNRNRAQFSSEKRLIKIRREN